ncbi:MAG: glycosyltransferase family 4 protein [Acidobacteriota bacterium]|nr:glycosyltransferase family 4 protein [Acidobacteriota bacterium]
MHILMIAPEPFFEPRGTPFSEYHRIRALTDLGHTVDLVTYPFGQDVEIPGMRVFRCLRPPFVRHAKIGPSFAKLPLDFLLTFTALRRALTTRYDVIHSHEEGALIGVALAGVLRIPHLYDMHSSLPQQLSNFKFSRSRLLRRVFVAFERLLIRASRVIIVICPHLAETVHEIEPGAQAVLIENAPGPTDEPPTAEAVAGVRREFGLAAATPVVLYTGTLEAYQGLELLLAAARQVRAVRPDVRFLLAGGKPDQVARLRDEARAAGVDDVLLLAGQRPAQEIPAFLEAADLLVSPRSRGTNTPLKIYQYLRSGRPIVATRLLTHTQVLNDAVAMLTEPTPDDYARGILTLLDDPGRARALGQRAQELADTKYTYAAYLARTREAFARLARPGASELAKDSV